MVSPKQVKMAGSFHGFNGCMVHGEQKAISKSYVAYTLSPAKVSSSLEKIVIGSSLSAQLDH